MKRLITLCTAGLTLLMSSVGATAFSKVDSTMLCAATTEDGALEVVVERLLETGAFSYEAAPALLALDCAGATLMQRMIDGAQAENLEYAVIDLGVNVNQPLMPVEAGSLTVIQYLMKQAAVARTEMAREFALEYMQDFRNVDFNPNLQLVTLK
ncbi:MAG: hypothetical protein CVV10_08455 [Gammaproteobacteria bacterium HGW-Gammaproteobacteria-14]|nr:MAG: hypothetical protein CVV10_08455 [Gammaproteobacteria bacterium HGW-Gammaproteobacteria-14]